MIPRSVLGLSIVCYNLIRCLGELRTIHYLNDAKSVIHLEARMTRYKLPAFIPWSKLLQCDCTRVPHLRLRLSNPQNNTQSIKPFNSQNLIHREVYETKPPYFILRIQIFAKSITSILHQ